MTTREEAIRLAIKAGMSADDVMPNSWMIGHHDSIERLIQLVENNTLKTAAEVCVEQADYGPVCRDIYDCEAAILALVKE